MKFRTHVLRKPSLRPKPRAFDLLRPIIAPPAEALQDLQICAGPIGTESELPINAPSIEQPTLKNNLKVELGKVQLLQKSKAHVESIPHEPFPCLFRGPRNAESKLWWPIPTSPGIELNEQLWNQVRKTLPLIPRNQAALLRCYENFPKGRVRHMKFIGSTLHAVFELPFRGQYRVCDLLFIADRRVRKTHRVELPATTIARLRASEKS